MNYALDNQGTVKTNAKQQLSLPSLTCHKVAISEQSNNGITRTGIKLLTQVTFSFYIRTKFAISGGTMMHFQKQEKNLLAQS